jgi:hypothetical protein
MFVSIVLGRLKKKIQFDIARRDAYIFFVNRVGSKKNSHEDTSIFSKKKNHSNASQ